MTKLFISIKTFSWENIIKNIKHLKQTHVRTSENGRFEVSHFFTCMVCCITSISLPCDQPMTSELSTQADKKVCVSCGCMISSHTPWIIQEQEQKLSKLSKLGQAKWRLYDTLLHIFTGDYPILQQHWARLSLVIRAWNEGPSEGS